MKKNREFDKEIKINEIKSEYFYRAIAILGISLVQLSKFKGKSRTYYAKRRNANLFSEADARLLKRFCEENYGDGVFEDKIYQAHLDFVNIKSNRQAMINQIENLQLEIERLTKENEELKAENSQKKNSKAKGVK